MNKETQEEERQPAPVTPAQQAMVMQLNTKDSVEEKVKQFEEFLCFMNGCPIQADGQDVVDYFREALHLHTQQVRAELRKEVEQKIICDNCHHYARYKRST